MANLANTIVAVTFRKKSTQSFLEIKSQFYDYIEENLDIQNISGEDEDNDWLEMEVLSRWTAPIGVFEVARDEFNCTIKGVSWEHGCEYYAVVIVA